MSNPPEIDLTRAGNAVRFYESEARLIASLVEFVVPALRAGDAAVVAATRDHRELVATAVAAAGVDLDEAISAGRFVAVDAAELLASITVDGALDPPRFREVAGALLDGASAGGRREVRVYSELVALLINAGDVSSTILVEELWSGLGSSRRFELLCGYPLDARRTAGRGPSGVGDRHAGAPTEGYSLMTDLDQHRHVVAELRAEASALRAELERLRDEQERLVELAYVDPVTGLANRRAFDRQLDREWALASRGESDSFVLIADLDGFKRFNDAHGHAAGDEVLRAFGAALRIAARRTDIVARIGGDEFGIVLVRCDERAVHAFRRRLGAALAEHVEPRFATAIGASVGHASLRRSSSPLTALDRADLAMLATKRSVRRRQGHAAPSRD